MLSSRGDQHGPSRGVHRRGDRRPPSPSACGRAWLLIGGGGAAAQMVRAVSAARGDDPPMVVSADQPHPRHAGGQPSAAPLCAVNYWTADVERASRSSSPSWSPSLVAAKCAAGVPGKLQMVFELFLGYMRSLVGDTVSEGAAFIVPLAATVGLYILVANWLDFLPLRSPIKPANSDLNQTLAMAMLVVLIVQWYYSCGCWARGLPHPLHQARSSCRWWIRGPLHPAQHHRGDGEAGHPVAPAVRQHLRRRGDDRSCWSALRARAPPRSGHAVSESSASPCSSGSSSTSSSSGPSRPSSSCC